MSIQHLISIDREASLSVDTGRLKIAFSKEQETHFIAACDIAVLVLAHPCIRVSLAVFQALAQQGAVIVCAGEKYMPCSMALPLGTNLEGAKRSFLQAKYLNAAESRRWWQQLVAAKILGQAFVAENFDTALAERFRLIASHVEPGDDSAREAQVAQAYWPAFFTAIHNPIDFRDKQGASDPANITLNYGYAVLRAIIARSLVSAGLCLNFEVGHCRKDNPFNLADDFIEPFRFLVDVIVWRLAKDVPLGSFDKAIKKQLLTALLASEVSLAGKNYRLFHGIDYAVNSFCLSLEDPRRKLILPNQPARPGRIPSALLWQSKQFYDETQ